MDPPSSVFPPNVLQSGRAFRVRKADTIISSRRGIAIIISRSIARQKNGGRFHRKRSKNEVRTIRRVHPHTVRYNFGSPCTCINGSVSVVALRKAFLQKWP